MSIAQKIYELRREVSKTHPNAEIKSIELSVEAERELFYQLETTHNRIELSPLEIISESEKKQRKIFGIEIKVTDRHGMQR